MLNAHMAAHEGHEYGRWGVRAESARMMLREMARSTEEAQP